MSRQTLKQQVEAVEPKPELRLIKGGPQTDAPPKDEKQVAFTRVANCIIRDVMPNVSSNAWKILTVISHQTTGWEKVEDAVSYSQLMDKTGIRSSATISKAIKELVGLGIIEARTMRDPVNRKLKATTVYQYKISFLAQLAGTSEDTILHFLKRQHTSSNSHWKRSLSENSFRTHEYDDAKGAASRKMRREIKESDIWDE